MPFSAEAQVLFAPAAAYRRLAKAPSGRFWLARPLTVMAVLGCTVSLMVSGKLTLRLILPVALYASFLPGLQMLWLAIAARGAVPYRRAVELSFAGHAAWSLALLAYG